MKTNQGNLRTKKRPEKPVGSFRSNLYENFVRTTDSEGNLNVSNMVLVLGSNISSTIPSQHYKSSSTEALSEFFNR